MPHGIVAAIVPESLLWHRGKEVVEIRHLAAEQGYWESIGAPFEYTTLTCYQLKIERMSAENLQYRWSESAGFESQYQENIEIALSCDRGWNDAMARIAEKPQHKWRESLEMDLDMQMESMIREGLCLLYNDRVKAQLLRSLMLDLSENYGDEAVEAPTADTELDIPTHREGQLSLF